MAALSAVVLIRGTAKPQEETSQGDPTIEVDMRVSGGTIVELCGEQLAASF